MRFEDRVLIPTSYIIVNHQTHFICINYITRISEWGEHMSCICVGIFHKFEGK